MPVVTRAATRVPTATHCFILSSGGGRLPAMRPSGKLNHPPLVNALLLHGAHWKPREVEREYASPIGETARVEPPIVGFSGPSAEGQTDTHSGPIGAALFERAEELLDIAIRETPALVLDLDAHALRAGVNREGDGGTRPGELEGVLQQVSYDRSEDVPVNLDRHSGFDGHHDQSDATGVRVQCRGRFDFFDESGYEDWLPVLNGLRETNLRERASDERA